MVIGHNPELLSLSLPHGELRLEKRRVYNIIHSTLCERCRSLRYSGLDPPGPLYVNIQSIMLPYHEGQDVE